MPRRRHLNTHKTQSMIRLACGHSPSCFCWRRRFRRGPLCIDDANPCRPTTLHTPLLGKDDGSSSFACTLPCPQLLARVGARVLALQVPLTSAYVPLQTSLVIVQCIRGGQRPMGHGPPIRQGGTHTNTIKRQKERARGLRNRGAESSSPSRVHVAGLRPQANTTSLKSDRHTTEWADVQRQQRVDGVHDA